MKIEKAVIPAAGFGTRLLPATKAQAKEMLPILDRPTLEYIIEEAVLSGIKDILIVTGRNKQSIENHFDHNVELELELERAGKRELLKDIQGFFDEVHIHYIRQKSPLGLGHAVLRAKAFVGGDPFALLLGDDVMKAQVPAIKQLMEAYGKVKTSVLGVQEVDMDKVNFYGIIDGVLGENGLYQVRHVVEKPHRRESPSNIAILGRYILTPEIFPVLENTPPGKNGEIQLTDAIMRLIMKQKVYAYAFRGKHYDVGNKFGYLKANIEFGLTNPEIGEQVREYLEELVNEF